MVSKGFKKGQGLLVLGFVAIFAGATLAQADERDPMVPRVPAGKMDEAKAMKAPYGDARTAPAAVVAEGKAIFGDKGTCVLCHGEGGQGDGPVGMALSPSPRNFTNCKFHDSRSDGELMYVIKNGSQGTGMVSMVPSVITEEEAWKVIAYERSFCKK
jgi:cytochrome c5